MGWGILPGLNEEIVLLQELYGQHPVKGGA